MKYILKNKDKDVLEFEVIEESEQIAGSTQTQIIQKINSVTLIDGALLPKNLKKENLQENLRSYIKQRKIPQNRAFANKIISTYAPKEEKLMDYVNASFALSLNDSYWIIPKEKQYKWKDFNLYSNAFEKSLELAAFGIMSQKISRASTSPEYTTNGMLRKCWHREDGRIYLYKGSSKMYESQAEPFSEYYAAQIAEQMGFKHVSYNIEIFHNHLISACPIFTDEDKGYLPAYYCLTQEGRKLRGNALVKEIMSFFDEKMLQDMMVFDGLIGNIDRHLGNFGMMIDNNTGEFLSPTPLFDNGLSMLTWLENKDLEKSIEELNAIIDDTKGSFEMTFKQQLRFYTQERHLQGLQSLEKFSFSQVPKLENMQNLDSRRLECVEKVINKRASQAIEYIKEKGKMQTKQQVNKKLKQLTKKDGSRSR